MKPPQLIIWLCCAIGAGLLAAAAYLFHGTRDFIHNAESAEGTVIDLLPSRSDNGKKVSVTFSPVVEFRTTGGQMIEFRSLVSSSPPAYREGEKVQVLYRSASPQEAEIDDFFSLWGAATILAGLGAVFSAVGAALAWAGGGGRRRQRLLRHGSPLRAQIIAIERNEAVGQAGRHPFRILAHWKNPVTAEVHVFRSENLWADPTPRLDSSYIVVHVDARNPKRYLMDTSFLQQPM